MRSIVNDVCDVVMTRISDGAVIFTAEAQLASLSQKVQEDPVYGGIGNKKITILRSNKEVDLQIRNAVFDSSWLEVSTGGTFSSATKTVYKKAEGLTATIAGELSFASATPKAGSIKVIDVDGNQLTGTATYATGKFSLTGIAVGKTYTVIYQEDVTGNVLAIKSDVFSEKYKIEYRTVEYSVDTNKIIKDLWIQFDSVLPSGNFDLSFENGKAQTPELSLMALVPPNSNEIGRYIEFTRP